MNKIGWRLHGTAAASVGLIGATLFALRRRRHGDGRPDAGSSMDSSTVVDAKSDLDELE